MLIDTSHPQLTISRQCDLLSLVRSGVYYRPRKRDRSYNEQLMRLIDRQYTAAPFFGVRQMTYWLAGQGHAVNVKRVRRLMRLMGLEAIYPKPRPRNLSLQNKAHPAYPYLLKGLTIDRPDQVWCADITYVPMRVGWLYLVAIMDWFSRYVLAWELSATLDASFCVSALERALRRGASEGRLPGVFNTDQGSQFTSAAFTGVLLGAGIAISMDGAGRAFDNIFVERLWRSVKYEEVYLKDYRTPAEAQAGLGWYLPFYNGERPHRSHDGRTPAQVYGIRRGEPDDAASAAAATVALRAPCAAAAGGNIP
jgi:putative transposase